MAEPLMGQQSKPATATGRLIEINGDSRRSRLS
jgi:hypothetical protein